MGWDDFHPHVFEIGDAEYGSKPDDLEDDDDTLREASAWAGEATSLTVAQALNMSTDGFTYVYDFAEEWRVRITSAGGSDVEADVLVTCVAGEHTGPQLESRDLDPFSIDAANTRLRRALRPRATPDYPAGPGASSEQQLLANLSLLVLMLGSRPTRHGTREAWKNIRLEVLDGLHEAGLIDSDPQRKSVTITDAGVAHAQRLLQRVRSL